ncbi:MAG: tRNA (guanosine(46)-N7)-methyltransferase TrmB [Alphaproteobacteria bacterium]|nr:tRNA (guanosine(46)-N7)-methyltransferase TrmB [Alphaproteobacteria bacterium]
MEKQEIRTFGRRHGKKLSARKNLLMENVLPKIAPTESENIDILEIGFGAGEHVRELALQHPNQIIMGAEPFENGVAALLSAICDTDNNIKDEYKNIRVWPDDVRLILSKNKFQFNEIWVLHPDPWPKARHEKRRLLSAEFLNLLGTNLAMDGKIIIGTDHWEYFDWILNQVKNTNLGQNDSDVETIKTRYQQKNMAHTTEPKYIALSVNHTKDTQPIR